LVLLGWSGLLVLLNLLIHLVLLVLVVLLVIHMKNKVIKILNTGLGRTPSRLAPTTPASVPVTAEIIKTFITVSIVVISFITTAARNTAVTKDRTAAETKNRPVTVY
jgi:hypothetical protein